MKKIKTVSMAGLLVLAGLLMSCDNSNSSNSANDAGVNVTGNWTLNAEGQTSTLILNQNGDTLTGSMQGAPLTGSINGNSISVSASLPSGPSLVVNGTVDGDTMSGSYTASAPNVADHTGTWTATKQ